MPNDPAKAHWFNHVGKLVPALASTLAALTTVFSFLFSYGVLEGIGLRRGGGGSRLRASWISVVPASDTARAIGDTLHLIATVSDKTGAALVGAQPTWTSEVPNVAAVGPDGSVVARKAGTTTITVAVDGVTARSRIIVMPRVASIRLERDSVITIAEGGRYVPRARALDSRDHLVIGRVPEWTVSDTSVAAVDSGHTLVGRSIGSTTARAFIDGVSVTTVVNVLATPSSFAVESGDAQHARAGTALAQPVVVKVTSARGRPVEGVVVRFTLLGDAGHLGAASVATDKDGRARTTWTLGDMPGRQSLAVAADGLDSTVTVFAESDPTAANTRVSALQTELDGTVASPLLEPVGVRVTDSTGRLLPNVPVSWIPADGGTIEALAPRTDSLGEIRARWALGRRAGLQHVRVHVGNGRTVPPLTVVARARAAAPASLALLRGDRQRGSAGAVLARPIAVRVTDSLGNPVADADVALSISAGSTPDSSLRTDSLGNATFRWSLGRAAGAHRATVRVTGIDKPLNLSAVAVAAGAESITFEDAPERSRAGKPLAEPVTVIVTDVFGNPVEDARVRFSARSGRVSPTSSVTDSKGRARVRWTLGARAGEQTLTVSVKGGSAKGSLSIEATVSSAAAATPRRAADDDPKRSSATPSRKRSARPL